MDGVTTELVTSANYQKMPTSYPLPFDFQSIKREFDLHWFSTKRL